MRDRLFWIITISIVIMLIVFGGIFCFEAYGQQAGVGASASLSAHGHTSSLDGGVLTKNLYTASSTTSFSQLSIAVNTGDVMIVCTTASVAYTTPPTTYYQSLSRTGGPTIQDSLWWSGGAWPLALSVSGSQASGGGCVVWKVTGTAGTLVLNQTVTTAGGTGVTMNGSALQVTFITPK